MDRNFRNETYFPATSFYVLSRVLNMYPGIEPRSPASLLSFELFWVH